MTKHSSGIRLSIFIKELISKVHVESWLLHPRYYFASRQWINRQGFSCLVSQVSRLFLSKHFNFSCNYILPSWLDHCTFFANSELNSLCCWKEFSLYATAEKSIQSLKWCASLHICFPLLNKIYLSLKPSAAWCCSSYYLLLNYCSYPSCISDTTSYWYLIQCTVINGLLSWEVLASSGVICPRTTPTHYFKELLIQLLALMSVWPPVWKAGKLLKSRVKTQII